MYDISLDLIDAPQVAMRSDINDEGIDDLASSIRDHGLLQPITVRPVKDRYEIIAGHRRFIACRRLGIAKIAAIIRAANDSEATILMVHENLLRRDINPVDEAVFLAKIMQERNLKSKDLASLLNRSEGYIQDRLDILHYPDYLVSAISNKEINLGAAGWLNKITDERVRRDYVHYAVLGGIATKRAIAWFRSWELGQLPMDPQQFVSKNPETGQEETKYTAPCVLCGSDDEVKNLMLYYAHIDCYNKIKQ